MESVDIEVAEMHQEKSALLLREQQVLTGTSNRAKRGNKEHFHTGVALGSLQEPAWGGQVGDSTAGDTS